MHRGASNSKELFRHGRAVQYIGSSLEFGAAFQGPFCRFPETGDPNIVP